MFWRHDTRHNDIQHNDTQHNDTQHNILVKNVNNYLNKKILSYLKTSGANVLNNTTVNYRGTFHPTFSRVKIPR